jgi:hypothetical protein
MGEKGNVAATASQGSGLLEGALDVGVDTVSTGTNVVVEGTTSAVSGVVEGRVRDRLDRPQDDENDEQPPA